jgi:hypothetical protein
VEEANAPADAADETYILAQLAALAAAAQRVLPIIGASCLVPDAGCRLLGGLLLALGKSAPEAADSPCGSRPAE